MALHSIIRIGMNDSIEVSAEEFCIHPELNDGEPSRELLEWASENIGEDPDKKDLLVSELRDMIFERGECIPHRTDDEFLLRFLRARHFIVGRAHRLMVNYYNFKESAPEYFVIEDVLHFRELAKTLTINAPPCYDQKGRRMLILNIGCWNTSEFTPKEILQLVIGLMELALLEPQMQIKGGVFVVDLSGLSMNMAWYLTPTIAKHITDLALYSYPIRTEEVHVLHASWIFDVAWNMFKPLISESVKQKIFFHGDDMESFHSHINPKCLPKRYGGVHPDYPLSMWLKHVLLKKEKIIQLFEKEGYHEIRLLLKEEEDEGKREAC